ncbi:MAG TPA: alpha/beta hydrolase [Mucilaginibacter sp.]|nr:alpha/beta hydrolase [Mucilaginibacter sp.]
MKRITGCFLFLLLVAQQLLSAQTAGTGRFFTSFDGVKIYYEVKGSGYPVVLIHGFTGTSQGWKRGKLYDALLNAGYRVIMMDLRGNGMSDKPHTDAGYADDAEVKDVMGLVTSLHIKSYDVVGYSRGSIIASELFVHDKRVNKTVMGGMGDDYTNPQWPRRIHAYKSILGDTTFHDVDAMMAYIHSQHFDNTALALQQKYQPSTDPKSLAAVRKPVLIVRGREDKDNGSETGLQNLIPGSKLVYVPGDHVGAFLTPEFADAVMDFIK